MGGSSGCGGPPIVFMRCSTADYPVVIEIPVAWGEMDAYGHLNNIVYFRYPNGIT